MERATVIELSFERNNAGSPATSADAELFLEDSRPLVNRAKTSRPGSVHSSFVKKTATSS